MSTLIRLQIKAFIRRWPLAVISALSIVVAISAGVFEVLGVLRHDAALADILSNFTRYSIVWPLVLAVLAYESTGAARLVDMEEAIETCPETAHRHWLATLVPPAIVLAGVFLVYVSLKLTAVALAGMSRLLSGHIVFEAILNVLLPSAIGLLFGAMAARRLGRYTAYASIGFLAFAIGPYSEILPALAQAGVLKGRGGLDLYPAYDLFHILAPDATWGMDPLYGFPLEIGRWLLAGAWLMALAAGLLPSLVRLRTRLARLAPAALATVAALALAATLLPSSELRRDSRFFDAASVIAEQIHYDAQADEHPQHEQPAGFGVARYDMRLAAGRQLSATVSMTLTDDTHRGDYRFTLYHGYRVKRVLGAGAKPLEFTQTSDYVTVRSSAKQARLTFEYAGSGNVCIANYQCVYLPGYFPYYPIPGFHRTWDGVRLYVSVPATARRPAEFSVAFESPLRLISDLDPRKGRFEGTAVAPGFIGGLLADKTVAGHRVVYYPLADADPDRLERTLSRIRTVEHDLGVTESVIPAGANVYEMPYLTQLTSSAVILPGAVYLASFDESIAGGILVAALPARVDRENLKDALELAIDSPGQIEGSGGEKPTPEEIARLESARRSARSETERVQAYHYPAASAVRWLLRQKMRAEGRNAALADTYRYLSSDSPMSELEFLTRDDHGEAR